MRIDVKIDADLLLECSLQLFFQVVNELSNPAIVFVVFLPVADEDVIIISFDNA